MQHLDGDKAEQLVRFRQYKNGDLDRIKVQQNFLHALAEQKLQLKYIGKIDDIYGIVSDNMETSMTPADLVQCGTQLLSIGKESIETITMPGTPQDIGGGSYVIPDRTGVEQIRETVFGYNEDGLEI
jgi:anionic cell wall polymer biosynthesis LytR-Cps2A-Psr (LCP) family protein